MSNVKKDARSERNLQLGSIKNMNNKVFDGLNQNFGGVADKKFVSSLPGLSVAVHL